MFLAGEPRILRMLPVILATAHLWFEQEPCLSRLAENEIEDRRGEDRDPRVPHDEDPEIPLHAATMERRSGARYLSSRTMLSAQTSPRGYGAHGQEAEQEDGDLEGQVVFHPATCRMMRSLQPFGVAPDGSFT